MVETVSTTSLFNLPIDELIEQASRRVGGEYVSGYEARGARIDLNLLMIEMKNRGHPLYHLEQRTLTTVIGTPTYSLGADVLAIVDVTVSSSTFTDQACGSMSWLDYFMTPDKLQSGLPSSFALDKTAPIPKISFYLCPDAVYTIKYWVIRKHHDINASYQLLDIAQTYLPAVVAGLAWFMALGRPSTPEDKILRLETAFEKSLSFAEGEDRDRNDLMIYPDLRRT